MLQISATLGAVLVYLTLNSWTLFMSAVLEFCIPQASGRLAST
jgi:hypothetical protein